MDSDYPFGIFKLFLIHMKYTVKENLNKGHMTSYYLIEMVMWQVITL
jgi:hypothetical protein